MRIAAGSEVGGYRVEGRLGRGTTGSVYRARAPDGSEVALKVLHLEDPQARMRFEREMELGRRLDHPTLIRVLDGGVDGGRVFIAMELVEGATLEEVLRERGTLDPEQVLELAERIAAGLAALHDLGLTHRDVKPRNLMVDEAGTVRILDLGLAHDPARTCLTETGCILGTPLFLAPEQLEGSEVDGRADLFALSVVLYCALSGDHPFWSDEDGADLRRYFERLRKDRPRPCELPGRGRFLEDFFQRALARRPEDRYQTADALVEALRVSIEEGRAPDEVRHTEPIAMVFAGGRVARVSASPSLEEGPEIPRGRRRRQRPT